MADSVGNLVVELSLDKSGLTSGLAGVKGEMSAFGSSIEGQFNSIGSKIGSALKTGLAAATLAVAGAATAGTMAFADYETGLNNVAKTTGMTAEQTKEFGKAVRSFSLESGNSVTELEKMAAGLGAIGIENNKLLDSTKQVSVLTTAYGTDVEKTTNFVGTMIKMYGKSNEGLKQTSSALNVLEGASRATPGYLMDFMDALVPMSGMFDINTDKALAFGSTLADAGIQADEGATSLKSAILYALSGPEMKAPTERINELTEAYQKMGKTATEAKKMAKAQATSELGEGNDRMNNWASLLGISVSDLTKQLNTDFLGTMKKSAQALNTITDDTKRATKANDIWGSYGLKVIGTMAGQAKNYDGYLKLIEQDTANGSQSAQKEWNKVGETISFAFDQLKAGMNDIAISIGEATSGPIKNLINYLMELQPAVKGAVEALVGGDLESAFKQFGEIGSKVFGDILTSAESALGGLSGVLSKYLTAGNINAAFDRMVGIAESSFAKIGDALIGAPWGSWANTAAQVLGHAMQGAINSGLNLQAWIANKLSSISSADAAATGKAIGKAVVDAISWGLANLPSIVSKAISGAFSIAGEVGRLAASFGKGIIDAVGGAISGAASSMVGFGKQIVDSIGLGISSGVNSVISGIETIINAAIGGIAKLGGILSNIPGLGGNSLVQGMANMGGVSLGKWNYTGYGTGGVGGSGGNVTSTNTNPYAAATSPAQMLQMAKANNMSQSEAMSLMNQMANQGMWGDQNVSSAQIAAIFGSGTATSTGSGTTSSAWLTSLLGSGTGSYLGAVTGSGYSGGTSSWLNDLLTGSGNGMTGGTWTAIPVNVVSMGGSPVAAGGVAGNTGLGVSTGTDLSAVSQAYNQAMAEGGTLKNMNQFNNMLVKASAEGSDFCEAMSEFGYLQEHTAGLFYESYIGPMQSSGATTTASPAKTQVVSAQTAAKTTTTAAKTSANTMVDAAYKIGDAFTFAGQNWGTTANTASSNWSTATTQASNYMKDTVYDCFNMWGEGVDTSGSMLAQYLGEGGSAMQSAATGISTQLAESGKFVNQATVSMSAGLTNWEKASSDHLKAMNEFDTKLNEHLTGTFTGLNTAIGSMATGNWSASFGGGAGGTSTVITGAAQAAYDAVKAAVSTSGMWGSTPQAGNVTWGSAGNAGWVGTGASASGAGWAASSQLASGASSGFGYSISNGVVHIGSYAEGGVITKPTLALIGEAGEREAVVPLSKAAEMGFGGSGAQLLHSNIYVDGRKIADAIGPAMVSRMRVNAGIKVR